MQTPFVIRVHYPRRVAAALIEAGFVLGRDLVHLAFPLARHDERSWSSRLHVPLQLFSGKLRRLADAMEA